MFSEMAGKPNLYQEQQDALANKDRERQADDIEKAIQGIQARTDMAPEDKAAAINEARTQLHTLYAPHEGPQLFKRLGRLFGIGDNSGPMNEQPPVNVPGVSSPAPTSPVPSPITPQHAPTADATAGAAASIPPAPNSVAVPSMLEKIKSGQKVTLGDIIAAGSPTPANPYSQKRQQMKDAGFTPDQIDKAMQISAGLEPKAGPDTTKYQPTLTETTDADGKRHYWRVPLEEGGKPEEVDFKGQTVSPKGAEAKPMEADIKDGVYMGVNDPANNKKYSRAQLDAGTAPKQALEIDADVKRGTAEKEKAQEAKESRAEARQRERDAELQSRMETSLQNSLKANDYKKANDIVNKAKGDAEGATDRARTMDLNLVAARRGDQQAMLSLVANHIGMTLGMQKGARITRAVWDEAMQSAPWLQRVEAKFDDRGFLSGVTLSPEQMESMVNLAHEKVQTMGEHVARVQKDYADDLSVKKSGTPKSGTRPPLSQFEKK